MLDLPSGLLYVHASRQFLPEASACPVTQRRQPNDESTEEYAHRVCACARPTEQKPRIGSVATENRAIRVCSNSRARVELGVRKSNQNGE
jgi:hypothetical protein